MEPSASTSSTSRYPCSFDKCNCTFFLIPEETTKFSVDYFLNNVPLETRDCLRCKHGLTWHRGARKDLLSSTITLSELAVQPVVTTTPTPSLSVALPLPSLQLGNLRPMSTPRKSVYKCTFKGCNCECYTIGMECAGLTIDDFLQHATHRQQCVLCHHALMWHPEASNVLRNGSSTLATFVDASFNCIVPSPRPNSPRHLLSTLSPRPLPVSNTALISPRNSSKAMTVAQTGSERRYAVHSTPPPTERSRYGCTFSDCNCAKYSLGIGVSGMSNSDFMAGNVMVQLCKSCSHGMIYHNVSDDIRSGELNVQTLINHSASYGKIKTPVEIQARTEDHKCVYKDCQCCAYRITQQIAEMSAESFLTQAPPFARQCIQCRHDLVYHPNVKKSLRRGTTKLPDLVDVTIPTSTQFPTWAFPEPTTLRSVSVPSMSNAAEILKPSSPKKPAEREPPPDMLCPITQELMIEPVILADGHSYELSAITLWLSKHNVSPMTGDVLPHKTPTPNYTLKKLIMAWKDGD